MSVRREDSCSEVAPVGCSWIPITPAKPNSTTEEAAQASPNWPRDFDLNSLPQRALACGGDIHNCGAGMPTNSPANEESLIGFESRLAADKLTAMGKNAAIERSDFARSSTSSCCVDPQSELEDRTDFHPRAEGMSSGNFLQHTVTDRSSISGSSLDHTAPPTTITDAAARKSIPQFEPLTPEKTSTGEYQQEHAVKPSSIEETPAGKRNKTTMDDKKKKKKSHLVDGQRENHKPDKGGTEGADMVKTPSQKIKRKKHRPKVIIEGRKKNTPKPSAKKVNAAEKTPQVKRKYVRKSWVTCPVGGGANGTDSDSKTPRSTGKLVGKRKIRTQGSSKDEDMDMETTESTEVQASLPTRRSCRRSLNFDINDDPVIDGISSECPSFNAKDQPETPHRTQETGVMMERSGRVIYHVYSRSKKRENFLSKTEQHPQSSLPSMNKDALKENGMLADQTTCTRRKSQIVFSDVTHDKEAHSVQVGRNPDGPRTPKGTSDSKGSGVCSVSEKQKRGLKRRRDETLEEAVSSAPVLHCPVNYKKRRTVRVNRRVASSIQIEIQNVRESWIKLFGSYCAQSQVNNLLSDKDATNGSQQVVEDLLPFETRERIRTRRSIGRTRRRNLASLIPEICKQWKKSPRRAAAKSRTQQNIEFLNEPPKCLEALAADNLLLKLARKKRSWRNTRINLRVLDMFKLQASAGASLGRPLAIKWKCVPPVDWIIDKLKKLDINAGSIASEGALVPYQNSGAVVPYDQARIRKQRPKVDLDDESLRVWTLLLENIDSEGIDGTNEENTKWWEEERRVFMGRAESFIARMHLVQGDRHFSPWKGSVVDSIVGVFLTQNVSDHLSSSAFMSLAAKFPAKRTNNSADLHDEGLGGDISESERCKLNSDDTFGLTKEILKETICGEYARMLQEFEEESIREMNSLKPSQNASWDDSVLEGNLRGPTDASLDPVISSEIIANRFVSSNEDGKHIEETLSSETPEISSQNSADSPIAQTTGTSDSCMLSTAEEETGTSFVKLLQMTGTVFQGIYGEDNDKRKLEERQYAPTESMACSLHKEDRLGNPTVPAKTIASCSRQSSSCCVTNSGTQSPELLFQKDSKSSDSDSEKELCMAEINELSLESASGTTFQKATASSCEVQKLPTSIACSSSNEQIQLNQRGQSPAQNKMQGVSEKSTFQQSMMDATGSSSNIDISKNSEHKEINSNATPEKNSNGPKSRGKISKEKESPPVDWDQLRKEVELSGRKRERTARTLDSVDWDAVRCADVNEIAQVIKERGMNNILAARIKDFLNRVVTDHGSIDLEWLRDAPPDKAKEYLLSIKGLGLKSTECVRLLTLHHLAFPVDTNVGRIAVRLGWVPLQPLPEEVQLHLLELYPMMETIQKYLWPRLCKLVQKTLYELHYQMITFGKVFCTKSKPNCNACPMRAECRHFASAYASARLALPAPQDKSIVSASENTTAAQNPTISTGYLQLPYAQTDEMGPKCGESNYLVEEPQTPEPVIEEPPTPEPDYTVAECDIEEAFGEDFGEIPTINLNMTEFAQNLQAIVQQNTEMQDGETSKALVALTPEAASIPAPKLKNVSNLRTEHQVYELPDSHQLLEGMDKREPDDPCPYLLAIWTPGETMDSIKPPEKQCSSGGLEKFCTDETCSSCNCTREAMSQTVRGTLLIPCRTAMRGSFPLNGTYFQVNEVFSDHESSLSPLNIPRTWLWNLPRRTVYFGTSIPSIFKGLTTEGIQYCFWRGFVCVRGFDRKTRAPRPLMARLHLSASKGKQLAKDKAKIDKKNA